MQGQAPFVQVKPEITSPNRDYAADAPVFVKRETTQDPPMPAQAHASRWDEPKPPSEQELQEMKAKEIEARIMAELPTLRGSYGIAKWEREVSALYYRLGQRG